jgi:Ca2+-binding RTX toxin-like protein
MSKRTSRPRRGRLHLENLEARAVPAAYLSGGWLYVVGSSGVNDQAVVADTAPPLANSTVIVTLNGQASVFSKPTITQGVRFYGYGGNDQFTTNLARPVVGYGGDGNDTLHGGSAIDQLWGQAGEDWLDGHGGNDSLQGGTFNDTLYGGDGNDWVTGQQANDYIEGGDGNDKLYGYTGNDTILAGDGNDTLSGWDGADDLYGAAGNDKLYGHAGNDYLNGGSGNDTLSGSDDDDELVGSSGNDKLYGNDGEDDLDGGTGNDSLEGGGLNDLLHGGDGNDWMTGQSGDDALHGDDGNDTMYGYTGNDTMYGDGDNDVMYGYTGNDLLGGGDGDDYLSGWDGNDLLYGREGNDSLYGGSGRDGLMGGNGVDLVSGGSDSDRYLTIGDHAEIVSMSGGDATIQFGGPKIWTYSEIEMVDGGLAKLHHRTGNTGNPKAPRMTFLRDITDYDINGDPWGNVGVNHNNGTITLYDSLFDEDTTHPAGLAGRVAQYSIHEIGHNWDSPTENEYTLSGENVVEYFRADSGWRNDLGEADPGDETVDDGQTYVKAGNMNNDNEWWYLESAEFVTDYAHVSPGEDFADTLAVVVMGNDFYRNGNDTPDAPTAKLAWMNAWLNNV